MKRPPPILKIGAIVKKVCCRLIRASIFSFGTIHDFFDLGFSIHIFFLTIDRDIVCERYGWLNAIALAHILSSSPVIFPDPPLCLLFWKGVTKQKGKTKSSLALHCELLRSITNKSTLKKRLEPSLWWLEHFVMRFNLRSMRLEPLHTSRWGWNLPDSFEYLWCFCTTVNPFL